MHGFFDPGSSSNTNEMILRCCGWSVVPELLQIEAQERSMASLSFVVVTCMIGRRHQCQSRPTQKQRVWKRRQCNAHHSCPRRPPSQPKPAFFGWGSHTLQCARHRLRQAAAAAGQRFRLTNSRSWTDGGGCDTAASQRASGHRNTKRGTQHDGVSFCSHVNKYDA